MCEKKSGTQNIRSLQRLKKQKISAQIEQSRHIWELNTSSCWQRVAVNGGRASLAASTRWLPDSPSRHLSGVRPSAALRGQPRIQRRGGRSVVPRAESASHVLRLERLTREAVDRRCPSARVRSVGHVFPVMMRLLGFINVDLKGSSAVRTFQNELGRTQTKTGPEKPVCAPSCWVQVFRRRTTELGSATSLPAGAWQ